MAAFLFACPKWVSPQILERVEPQSTQGYSQSAQGIVAHILKLSEPCGFLVCLVVNSKISWLTENTEELRSFKRGVNQNINISYAEQRFEFPPKTSISYLPSKEDDRFSFN